MQRLPEDDPQLLDEQPRHTGEASSSEQEAFQAILSSEGSGVFGITGKGKSNFVKRLVDYCLEHLPDLPIIVNDMKDEYSELGRPRAAVRLGALQARWTAEQLAWRPSILKHNRLQLAVVPMGPTARDWGEAFNLVARLLRHAGQKRILWIVEEVQYFEPYEREWVEAVATQWRDYGVILVLVSQRAGGIELNARSQLQTIVSFAQVEPPDIEALQKRTGRTDPTYADRVARLNTGEFQLWQIGDNKNGEEIERRRLGLGEDPAHHDRSGSGSDPLRSGEDSPGEGGAGAGEGQRELGVQGGNVLRLDQAGVKKKKPPAQRHTAAAARAPAPRHTAAAAAPPPPRRRFKNKTRSS